jgi:DNA-binding transcriptional LysR family regulator
VAIVAAAEQALCALMMSDHPLASRNDLRLHDCLAYPLALGDATLAGRALIERVLAQASFELDPRLISNSVETMKAFARMNRGVCFQFRKCTSTNCSPAIGSTPTRRPISAPRRASAGGRAHVIHLTLMPRVL